MLNTFNTDNKVSKTSKNESYYNYDSNYAFYEFYKDFKKIKRRSLDSKYNDMKNFYMLLNAFISTHKAPTDETNDCKSRILSHVKLLYNNYLNAYKNICDNNELTDEDKIKHGYKQFEIIHDRNQGLKSTKKTDEIQKPLWFKINRDDFNSLIQDVHNNLNNNEFKTTVNKKTYDLKNAKNVLVKITTQKISEKNALELFNGLITPDITKPKNAKD